jgi:hypothetical protein
MSGACFIHVALGVEVKRRLNTAVTQDALHCLGSTLPLLMSQLESECLFIVKLAEPPMHEAELQGHTFSADARTVLA